MIEGITKRLGIEQLTTKQRRVATAAYLKGLGHLSKLFDRDYILELNTRAPDPTIEISAIIDMRRGRSVLGDPTTQYKYEIDPDLLVCRSDSDRLTALGKSIDDIESLTGVSIPGFNKLLSQQLPEERFEINNQPIDLEEVTELVAMLERGRRVPFS
jgi:hypothetical protein